MNFIGGLPESSTRGLLVGKLLVGGLGVALASPALRSEPLRASPYVHIYSITYIAADFVIHRAPVWAMEQQVQAVVQAVVLVVRATAQTVVRALWAVAFAGSEVGQCCRRWCRGVQGVADGAGGGADRGAGPRARELPEDRRARLGGVPSPLLHLRGPRGPAKPCARLRGARVCLRIAVSAAGLQGKG